MFGLSLLPRLPSDVHGRRCHYRRPSRQRNGCNLFDFDVRLTTLRPASQERKQTCCVSAVVILSRVKTVSSQENRSQHASPLSQLSNLLCRHLARLMSHAGAKDEYNTIEGLLAPVRAGALQPLSGRYLMALAAGQGSLMWSHVVAPCAWH